MRSEGKMMAQLKGENQIGKFSEVAERLVSKISSYEGVSGIVLLGGIARGFTDKFSDLDVTTILGTDDGFLRTKIRDTALAEEKCSGIEIDMELHLLEDIKSAEWDEIERWEFSKAKIVSDPEGETKEVLTRKLMVPEDFWTEHIAACAEYIEWYCCPIEESVSTIAEAWVERGDVVSAHHCLNYGVELMLKMIFALNREFLPPPKWKLFYSYRLRWLPEEYKELVKEAMTVREFSATELDRRLRALRKMWRWVVPKMEEETDMTLDQIHEYYVQNMLGQTSASSN